MALESLNKVLLSWPTVISLEKETTGKPRRSWIQLAKTGNFVSTRYGKFSITKQDLSMMFTNFNDVTPKAPTELPIDYDHLSMDPKKPGDGIAAGWMKKLELREDGQELWAEIEWTPDGAERIQNQEYRFVSPSFVKDHTHKDGKKIGTTLLAAAITNHPFLEGMKALTLYNFSTIGDLKVDDKSEQATAHEISLSEVGQRVMIAPGNARTQDEIGGTFEITEVVGDGENAFVTIKDANGVPHKWFRATELLPASATPANPIQPNLVPGGAAPAAPAHPGMPAAAAVPAGSAAAPMTAVASNANVPGAPTVDPATGLPIPAGTEPGPLKAGHEAVAKQVAAAGAAGTDAKGAEPKPGEPPKPGEMKPGAVEAKPGMPVPGAEAKPGEAPPPAAGADKSQPVGAGDDVEALIKKKVAAALAGAQPQKGNVNMMFKLRNDKNEEIEVSAEQLAAAGIKVVPEGATVIPTNELVELRGTVTSLSTRMETLTKETADARAESRRIELKNELDRLSKGGFILKTTRDALEAQFKDATDLAAFKTICASFTTPVVMLGREHGAGGDAPVEKDAGDEAQSKIMALASTMVKDRGMSLRDATIAASAELVKESEAYREKYSGSIQ